MPGPTGQHTHILQQERATKKVTGVSTEMLVQPCREVAPGLRITAGILDAGKALLIQRGKLAQPDQDAGLHRIGCKGAGKP